MTIPIWLKATVPDLDEVDAERPIAGLSSADTQELSDAYSRAAEALEGQGATTDSSAAMRLFTFLSALLSMYLKSRDRAEPFGPRFQFSNGRSAIPEDFLGHLDLLSELAARATTPVIRARLADVCWLLDRKRGNLGVTAITAYIEIIEGVECGALEFLGTDGDCLDPRACDLLRRALFIGLNIGRDKAEVIKAREAIARFRDRAIDRGMPASVIWFSELDMEFGVSAPDKVAAGVEAVLGKFSDRGNIHDEVSLWQVAARAYRQAKSSVK